MKRGRDAAEQQRQGLASPAREGGRTHVDAAPNSLQTAGWDQPSPAVTYCTECGVRLPERDVEWGLETCELCAFMPGAV